jgi:hypothetical protein
MSDLFQTLLLTLTSRNASKQLNVLTYLDDVRFVEGSLEQRLLGRFSSYILFANNLVRGYFDPQSDVVGKSGSVFWSIRYQITDC